MKKIFCLIFLNLFLLSCAQMNEWALQNEADRKERELEMQRQIIEGDKIKCRNYGFKDDSESFSGCMMQLDMARQEEEALKKVLRCERIKKANSDPNRQPTGFWGGVLEGMSEAGC